MYREWSTTVASYKQTSQAHDQLLTVSHLMHILWKNKQLIVNNNNYYYSSKILLTVATSRQRAKAESYLSIYSYMHAHRGYVDHRLLGLEKNL